MVGGVSGGTPPEPESARHLLNGNLYSGVRDGHTGICACHAGNPDGLPGFQGGGVGAKHYLEFRGLVFLHSEGGGGKRGNIAVATPVLVAFCGFVNKPQLPPAEHSLFGQPEGAGEASRHIGAYRKGIHLLTGGIHEGNLEIGIRKQTDTATLNRIGYPGKLHRLPRLCNSAV